VDAEYFEAPTAYTVEEAAEVLQLTPGRVRQLLRDEDLDGIPPTPGSGQRGWSVSAASVRERLSKQQPRAERPPPGDRGELVEALRRENEYLRRQLDQATERDRENRRLLAGLIERVPALEAPAGHTPPDQPPGSAESAGEASSKGPIPHERETAAQPRPWWRKVFGG
jgi:hypothetical protein